MKILQASQHVEVQHRLEQQRAQRWQVERAPRETTATGRSERPDEAPALSRQNLLEISRLPPAPSTLKINRNPLDEFLEEQSWQLRLLASTLEQLTGRPIRLQPQPLLLAPDQFPSHPVMAALSASATLDLTADVAAAPAEAAPPLAGAARLKLQERISERETLNASFTGAVRTDTGDVRAFDVELRLERALEAEVWRDVRLQDPLVLQLEDAPLSLADERFAFDLSSDGVEELIPRLGAGYGLLALDRNGDGVINNGSELFGAQTGQGFAELAAFDEDGNGFIDSGDSVYQHLLVWKDPGAGAEPELLALASVGVDAISLQAVTTPFRLTDHLGETLGQLRSSAVTLGSGGARLIHQIDFSL